MAFEVRTDGAQQSVMIERRLLSGFGKLPKAGIEEMKMLRKMFSAA